MDRILPKDAILIPESAKRVFKGEIFDVYQWDQKLYDGNLATFEMLKRPDTAIILAVKDNEILYVKDTQPPNTIRIQLPGGRVDAGETWEQAARRELVEETGMTFKNWRLIDVVQPLVKMEWFVALYIAWNFESQSRTNSGPGEKIEVKSGPIKNVLQELKDNGSDYLPQSVKDVKVVEELLSIEAYNGKTQIK